MQKLNCCGNTEKNKLSVFWSATSRVIDMDTCTGAHNRLHATADEETTNNVFYAPNVLSVQELMDKAKELLTKTNGKKEDVDFLVPYLLWVY